MRLIFLFILLAPNFAFAQDAAPIIAVEPSIRHAGIYALREGEPLMLLAETDVPELFLAPDGQKLAILDYPTFVSADAELEPGDYPDDLFLIDLNNGERKPLLTHYANSTLDRGAQFYNGTSGGVRTNRAWDDPNSIGGSRLFHFLAWSPESDQITQVQTVVTDGRYPGEARLVVYDVATGSESVIAELGEPETGYAVFWFDAGIVLYADPSEGTESITVFAPDGTILHEWTIASGQLAHENPVRHRGEDYLVFGKWSIFDVTTGEFSSVDGTIARVSANAPNDSLVLEACDDRENLRPTWDVYSATGEKLTNLTRVSRPTLSPDGQRVAFVNHENRAVTIFGGAEAHSVDTATPFTAQSVVWGATVYTFTSVGADECGRGPARG